MQRKNQISEQMLTLQSTYLDFLSPKTQLVIVAILSVVICFVLYAPTLHIGFLLDDFLHLDYISRAGLGDTKDFLANLWGNWAGSDIMLSYRPFSSLSLMGDYLIWHANAWGYHFTNIILTFICALFVGLISLELTGLHGNRLHAVAAVWSVLLFSVYPLHPESSAWIIGRVDLLCTVFYLISIFCYLRYRLLRETSYLVVALVCFVLSLASKEMAVTLPCVIAAAELLLYSNGKTKDPLQQGNKEQIYWRIKVISLFWLVLCLMAVVRFCALGHLIGGYSGESNIGHSLSNFFNKATLFKIFFLANEEVIFVPWLKSLTIFAYIGISVIGITRIISQSMRLRTVGFLVLWTLVSVLPAYQIWQIAPNLVGSRLFFLGSAPFCILLPLVALPAIDTCSYRMASIWSSFGSGFCFMLFLSWSILLQGNLKPWVHAGIIMQSFRSDLEKVARNAHGDKILVLNLPTDISGAGLLNRGLYLKYLMRPPHTKYDLSNKFIVLDTEPGGSRDFIDVDKFFNLLKRKNLSLVLIWKKNHFVEWKKPTGEAVSCQISFITDHPENEESVCRIIDIGDYCRGEARTRPALNGPTLFDNFTVEPKDVAIWSDRNWHVEPETKSYIERNEKSLTVSPGKQAITIWLPVMKLNPLLTNVATVQFDSSANMDQISRKLKLVWQDVDGNISTADFYESSKLFSEQSTTHKCNTHTCRGDAMRLPGAKTINTYLGKYKSWTLNPGITKIGLHFEPGDYEAALKDICFFSFSSKSQKY